MTICSIIGGKVKKFIIPWRQPGKQKSSICIQFDRCFGREAVYEELPGKCANFWPRMDNFHIPTRSVQWIKPGSQQFLKVWKRTCNSELIALVKTWPKCKSSHSPNSYPSSISLFRHLPSNISVHKGHATKYSREHYGIY